MQEVSSIKRTIRSLVKNVGLIYGCFWLWNISIREYLAMFT